MRDETKDGIWRVLIVVGPIVAGIAAFTLLYVAAQFALGNRDLDLNLTNGLFFSFLILAVLVVVAPAVVRMFKEDIAKTEATSQEEWSTRMRTLIAVALTVVLLIFVMTWAVAPDRLLITGSSATQGGTNATANQTTVLHPFAQAFFSAYAVVLAFYFTTSAAEGVAKTLKGDKQAPGGKAGTK